MEFDPPIPTRETDELIRIANYTDDWNPLATEQAREELSKRKITQEEQDIIIQKWNEIEEKEWKQELASRKTESYGVVVLIIMAFQWPWELFKDWSLRSDGYSLMFKERIWAIVSGILLYALTIGWISLGQEERDAKWQNEVNNSDIYEWERNRYSDEEFAQKRRETIEEVISLVTSNEKTNTVSVIVVNKDTLKGSILSLRELDPMTIRDIIFEKHFSPRTDVIKIKLLEEEFSTE